MLKRVTDIVGATVVVVLLAPLLALVALLIKLDSRGPVFYRGRRMGRGLRPFHVLKFRSMTQAGAPAGMITAPGVRTYQVWYRDVLAFCTPAPFNLSNGYQIVWGP